MFYDAQCACIRLDYAAQYGTLLKDISVSL